MLEKTCGQFIQIADCTQGWVVMNGCESWTIKKAELGRSDAFELWCWRRLLSIPWTHFQGKPFNIKVIQSYTPTSNAEEAEVEQFYEDLQDLLELTPQKDFLFIKGTGMQK